MTTVTREQLHSLVDRIPEGEVGAAERFLQFLLSEPVGPAFAESIQRGLADAAAGRNLDCASFDEMVEKLLGDPAR